MYTAHSKNDIYSKDGSDTDTITLIITAEWPTF